MACMWFMLWSLVDKCSRFLTSYCVKYSVQWHWISASVHFTPPHVVHRFHFMSCISGRPSLRRKRNSMRMPYRLFLGPFETIPSFLFWETVKGIRNYNARIIIWKLMQQRCTGAWFSTENAVHQRRFGGQTPSVSALRGCGGSKHSHRLLDLEMWSTGRGREMEKRREEMDKEGSI